MKEADGTYKEETKYIWQIKSTSHRFYKDNVDSTMFDNGLEGLKQYIRKTNKDNLDHRLIKRTVKEDLVKI